MGLESIVSGVLTRYKADVSDHKAAIKSLRGEQKAHHQQMLADVEAQNRKLDGHIATLGKVTLGITAIAGAAVIAKKAYSAYLEDTRLESAAAGANIDALRASTRGLIETDTLLAFAGKAQNGVWKLNQGEMESVLQGAMALRKTMGVELAPTIEKLTEAVGRGSTKAFKEFGIAAENKGQTLQKLRNLYQGLNGDVGMAGDSMAASGVKMADTFDNLQGELGKLVVALEPAIEMFADFIGLIPQLIDGIGDLVDKALGVDTKGGSASEQVRRQASAYQGNADQERYKAYEAGELGYFGEGRKREAEQKAKEYEAFSKQLTAQANRMEEEEKAAAKVAKGLADAATLLNKNVAAAHTGFDRYAKESLAGSKRRPPRGATGKIDVLDLSEFAGNVEDFGNVPGGLAEGFGNAYRANRDVAAQRELSASGADIKNSIAEGQAAIEQMLAAFKEMDELKAEKGGILSRIFGTPAEIDEMTVAIEMASSAFSVMTSAATAGFDAWITGSESIGAAMNKAVAEALRGVASQMLIESVKHTAFGLGALAFGPIMGATASAHFAAAGAFAGGALLAGGAARALGASTGQWSHGAAGAGAAHAPSVTRGASSNDRSDAPINIYVGAEWAAMSPIQQSQSLRRAIAKGRSGSDHIRRG